MLIRFCGAFVEGLQRDISTFYSVTRATKFKHVELYFSEFVFLKRTEQISLPPTADH